MRSKVDAPVGLPKQRSRPRPASDASRILALQRLAGNRATTALIQRQVVGLVARPTLQKGDLDKMVGVLQQKLNALGEKLVIDADFGGRTQAAVQKFKRANGITPADGVAETATWAKLDVLAPGGDVQPDGSLSPVRAPTAADPNSPTAAGKDVKPVLRIGSKGASVGELHEKLNAQGATLPVAAGLAGGDAMEFTAETDAAVKNFQRTHPPLGADGVVGKKTWAKLDALVPGASMGRVDRFGTQKARGMDFGGQIAYDWALEPDATAPKQLTVRVRYEYQDDPDPTKVLPNKASVVGQMLGGITKVWNVFKAEEAPLVPTAPKRPDVKVEFKPEEGAPPDKRVVLSRGPGASNASHYFILPTDDLVGLAAHEFGHHFGLQDEYQQTAADHQRQTGEAAPVGDAAGDGTPPQDVAREIGTALRTPPRSEHGTAALAVITAHNLTQGAFAQRVASRYLATFGTSVVADCNRLIDTDPSEGPMSKQRKCTQPFLYTADNLMGGAETQGGAHAHDVAPRHVRHLVALVEARMGGVWNPVNR